MSAKTGKYKVCEVCSKEYYIKAQRAEQSKWCSSECWKKRRKLNNCEYCKKLITSYHGKKYCSRKCGHLNMVGDKSPRWKDGKSLERDRGRLAVELTKWRKSVYSRDNYTCQQCGSTGIIHAHHIIEWAVDESKRFDVTNGVTLCIICHGKIHGKDFTKRDKKKCPDCDKPIKRESKRCRVCSTINQWKRQKSTALS